MNLYDIELKNSEILETKNFRWKNFCLDHKLYSAKPKLAHRVQIAWNQVDFLKNQKSIVPSVQGIYMFVVDISGRVSLNSTSQYVLYVGQAGDLRSRFLSYFNYIKSDKPSDFLKRCMVLIWKGRLKFHYFQTQNLSDVDLTKVEFDLIDNIVPPINQRFRGRLLKKAIKLYSPR